MDTVTEQSTAQQAAQELANAVMPDNAVQSITQTLLAEDNQSASNPQESVQQTQPMQPNQSAPACYDLVVPDGYFLSDGMRSEFTGVAQQYGLTNEAANALIGLHIKQVQASAREMESRIADHRANYERMTRQDPEIGGAKFEASLNAAKNALSKYGNKALIDVLNETGLGSHPEVIRAFAKIGAAISEGRYVPSNNQSQPEKKTLAQKIYGV